jgi:chromosome segregation ATPase
MEAEYIQMDMFNNSELDQIKEEIKVVRTRTDNCRRGLFARHNELAKLGQTLYQENEDLKFKYHSLRREIDQLNEYMEEVRSMMNFNEPVLTQLRA